jgi:hypothetical protein
VANGMAGAPLNNWQVRQWHHPVSKGSLHNSYRTAPQRHPPERFFMGPPLID